MADKKFHSTSVYAFRVLFRHKRNISYGGVCQRYTRYTELCTYTMHETCWWSTNNTSVLNKFRILSYTFWDNLINQWKQICFYWIIVCCWDLRCVCSSWNSYNIHCGRPKITSHNYLRECPGFITCDDIMIWVYYPCYLSPTRRSHWSLVLYLHKDQLYKALSISVLLVWTSCWTNSLVASALGRHYDHVITL